MDDRQHNKINYKSDGFEFTRVLVFSWDKTFLLIAKVHQKTRLLGLFVLAESDAAVQSCSPMFEGKLMVVSGVFLWSLGMVYGFSKISYGFFSFSCFFSMVFLWIFGVHWMTL